MEDAETGQRVILEHLGMMTEPACRRRWCAKLKWYRAQKVLPAEEGGGEMGTLIATTEENGIDSIAIDQQLRELLALEAIVWREKLTDAGRTSWCSRSAQRV